MKNNKRILLVVVLLLLFCGAAAAAQSVISILHVNDFHGFAEPYRPFGSDELLGGVTSLASEVARIRAERPVLLLAAGDMLQGNNWANLFLGESVVELMNAMQFDAMVLGNHEFDFGTEVLRKRISEASFPVLAANVEGLDMVRPYVIRELGGLRIGIIGVVTEDVPVTTHPRNVTGLRFLPITPVVEKYLAVLKDKADIVIVVSHIGHAADRELAGQVNGVTAIVGGHSHTRLLKPVVINNTLVLQAWEHGKALGELDLTIKDGKVVHADGRLIDIKPSVGPADENIKAIIEKYRAKVDALLDEYVAEAEVDFDGEHVRAGETNLGDLMADIIRSAAGADAAIIGGGSIRTSIKKGRVLMKHVYAVSPFNNYVVAIKLTGRQIRSALEHGVSSIDEDSGRFPQVSGIRFSFSKKAPQGSRVKDIFINDKPLEPEREYSVATNDFLAAGGDGYKAFGDAVRSSADYSETGGIMKGDKLLYSDSGRWIRDLLIGYLRAEKRLRSPAGGRILEIKQ